MGLLALFRRSVTLEPSAALLAMQTACDEWHAALTHLENVVETGAQTRLSCRGMTSADLVPVGAAHRQSSVAFIIALPSLEGAVKGFDACRDNLPRPDECEAVAHIRNRVLAMRHRMAEVLGTATAIST